MADISSTRLLMNAYTVSPSVFTKNKGRFGDAALDQYNQRVQQIGAVREQLTTAQSNRANAAAQVQTFQDQADAARARLTAMDQQVQNYNARLQQLQQGNYA